MKDQELIKECEQLDKISLYTIDELGSVSSIIFNIINFNDQVDETVKGSLITKINSKIALNKVSDITKLIICLYVNKFN